MNQSNTSRVKDFMSFREFLLDMSLVSKGGGPVPPHIDEEFVREFAYGHKNWKPRGWDDVEILVQKIAPNLIGAAKHCWIMFEQVRELRYTKSLLKAKISAIDKALIELVKKLPVEYHKLMPETLLTRLQKRDQLDEPQDIELSGDESAWFNTYFVTT
jgi:hypothetical protein